MDRSVMTRRLVSRAVRRRPGPLGIVLLVPTWLVIGLALVAYIIGIVVIALLALVVATLRLLLAPLSGLPGVRHVQQRREMDRYAKHGVEVLEDQLRVSARRAGRSLPDA